MIPALKISDTLTASSCPCSVAAVLSDSVRCYGLEPHQAPLSRGFPRQEYWSGLTFPSPGDLPDPGIEPVSPALQVISLLQSHWGAVSKYSHTDG